MGARIEHLMVELVAAVREEVGALPTGVATLGEELKRARATARLSLQEVADRSGFTKSHIWEIEQGRSRNPTIAVVAGLSKGLGIPFLRLAQAALNSSEEQRQSPNEVSADDLLKMNSSTPLPTSTLKG